MIDGEARMRNRNQIGFVWSFAAKRKADKTEEA